MSTIRIRCLSAEACRVVHEPSGAALETDLPPEYGGSGASFSATDLLAASLGVCVATNVAPVAERHGLALDAIDVRVEKALAREPKRVARLAVTISVGAEIEPDLRLRLERAARHCAVHRSLHPDVEVSVALVP